MCRVRKAAAQKMPRGCGGIGRRARLRGVWFIRMGSSPISRTKNRQGESLADFLTLHASRMYGGESNCVSCPVFLYFYFNIARIRSDLTSASVCRFGNVNTPRIGLRYKHLIGKQTACNIACIRFDENLSSIRAVKLHIARASLDRKFFCGNNIIQINISRTSA